MFDTCCFSQKLNYFQLIVLIPCTHTLRTRILSGVVPKALLHQGLLPTATSIESLSSEMAVAGSKVLPLLQEQLLHTQRYK